MIGIIVDGAGDHAAFKARYSKGVKVMKADGPRGHSASEEAIAAAAKKQIDLLRAFGCIRIAIVTDFEGRSPPWKAWCEKGAACVRKIHGVEVLFVVADQMLENWFLADIAHLAKQKNYLKPMKAQKNYESTHGKRELKKCFVPGVDYNEVKHSAELFPLVRGDEAAKRSASFANFRSALKLD